MVGDDNVRSRKPEHAPVALIGDIGVLTTQELAEFIDRVEPVGSLDEALAPVASMSFKSAATIG